MKKATIFYYAPRWLFGIVATVFIILKLTKVIHWSWMWVLAPLLGPWTIHAIYLIILGYYVIAKKPRKRKEIREDGKK